ncbi:DUF4111 domain-containing protein [Actinoplanes sp. NBC_00393]
MTPVEELAARCADAVGGTVRSVILHGSLAAGGFRAGRSDIDLLIVVDSGLSDSQASALEEVVREADVGDASGIDLHVVTADVAAVPTRTPAVELQVGRYPGEFEVERRRSEAPDLLAELSMARAQGRALVGAAPVEVIAPVPHAWVVDRGRHWLRTWQSLTDDTEHAAFMVLTACRMWRFAADGVHSSKIEAAEWALTRNPSLTVIRQAVRQYTDDPAVTVDEKGIAALLETVLRFEGPMTEDGPMTERIVTAAREISAAAADIFELIADPSLQPSWDGNDNLSEAAAGQRVRAVGEVFTMTTTSGNIRENHVVEFAEGRLIAWRPAEPGQNPPGHLWRWELDPVDAGRTRVTHTYDWTQLTDERRLPRAQATTADRLQASLDRLATRVNASE